MRHLRALPPDSSFVSAIQHEFEEKNRWKVELARMSGRGVPTTRMSLDELQVELGMR